MKKSLLTLFVLFLFSRLAFAQIINGQDTLYGNEWIDFSQTYFKIPVAADGIYRLTQQTLQNAGVPVSEFTGGQVQIFHNGEEIPLFVTTGGPLSASDYIEFYGKKNTSELDRYLFANADEDMMNPRYSLVTDTAAYFLTWPADATPRRFEAVANDLTNLPPKEEFYWHELVLNYSNYFFKKQDSHGISSSDYGPTEGFAGNYANAQVFNLNPTDVAAAGGNAELSIRYAGNLGSHQQVISLNGQPLTTDEFYGYVVRQLKFEVPNASLSGSMELKFQGMASNTDKQRISNIELRYPRHFNFDNQPVFFFDLEASATRKYLEIENFNMAGGNSVLYDLTNALRIPVTIEGGLGKVVLPPSAAQRSLVLVNDGPGIQQVNSLSPVDFIDYENLNAQYIIISNPRLYDDGAGNNWVQEYANYRSSAAGGGFSTVIVNAQQLYDQFAWGLDRHPLAIRDFAHFVKKHWEDAQYFLIIGKGREYRNVRTEGQLNNASNATYFVPTFGYPGSDNLLFAGSDGFTPVIPAGRIAASKPEDIKVYLDKVKQFEANRDLPQTIVGRGWTKRLMHLGGGAQPGEQSLIKSYLGNLETVIEDSKMGGKVRSFFKTSTDPIQIPQTQQLFDVINEGVSVLTFFGHSGVGTFDFSIDNPDNYENTPRFPLMISLGCYAGNIHTPTVGVSERFVLFDKGAIAFAATAGQGFISSLYVFSNEFYRLMGNDMYGEALGYILQSTIKNVNTGGYGENLIRQQLNFHGDPAIRLISSPGPDFLVDASSVSFSPSQVNISLDSFEIQFKAVNIGSRTPDSIVVQVTQEMPSGIQKTVVDELVPAPGFEEELTFRIPTGGKEAAGQNRYYIKVDATDRVEELPLSEAEANNDLVSGSGAAGISLFITDNSAVAVYPAEFSIVSSPDIVLKASTTNALLPPRKYLFELDTTETFDSQLLLHTELVQAGGVLRWQPPMNWQDSTVYFWRVSPDSISPQQGFSWSISSFTYIPGSPSGWSQSHFYQFKKDEFVNMELPEPGNLKYISNFKDFNIRNAVNAVEAVDLRVNNAYYGRYWGLPDAGVYVLWMDSVFVEPRVNFPPGDGPYQYGIPHPNGWWVRTFMFDASVPEGRKELMDFLEEVISDHEYVAFFTVQKNAASDYKPEEWAADSLEYGRNLFQVL
ncbi:MAG: C25 family cysteine peptidase, partial [Saprospiraceae bacterium]